MQSRRVFSEDGKWPALYGGEGGGHGYIKTEEKQEEPIGFDGYNGDLTGDKAATLGVNCGMATGRNGVIDSGQLMVFAANQRDEVRDLRDVAGTLGAQPGMKQQTFVAVPVNTQIATRHKALGEGTWYVTDLSADEFRYAPDESGELIIRLSGDTYRYLSNRVIPAVNSLT